MIDIMELVKPNLDAMNEMYRVGARASDARTRPLIRDLTILLQACRNSLVSVMGFQASDAVIKSIDATLGRSKEFLEVPENAWPSA